MTLSLGQGLFNLLENSRHRSALPFEEAQPVPKSDDFAFSLGVHCRSLTTEPP
jgi:hypothetical protein